MAGMVYDKCSEEVLREKFQRRMPQRWARYRSRLVKVLDNYYFQELPPDELKRALEKAVILREDIKTWDDVSKCCEEIQTVAYKENELHWNIHIVPNFNETESCVIMKVHHVINDGLGCMIMLSTLQDKYDPNVLI